MENNILRRESSAPLLEVDDRLRGESLTNFQPGKE